MFKHNFRRLDAKVNAGSMADIAFLLLIFFLVTTTILNESGILVKLPPINNPITNNPQIPPQNVFVVKVNADDELLVEGDIEEIRNLKALAKDFILNPRKDPSLSNSPKKAVISLQNDRGTSYETYIGVYNELQAAYNELWDESAKRQFGISYKLLSIPQKRNIRKDIPLVISEADPSGYGEGSDLARN